MEIAVDPMQCQRDFVLLGDQLVSVCLTRAGRQRGAGVVSSRPGHLCLSPTHCELGGS